MPTKATQLPLVRDPAVKVGRGLWRKQVLPLGSVEHPTKGKLEFSRDTLQELVQTFDAGAMDQIVFSLVTDENRHSDDPERHRGEIRRLELADDGLYAVIDPTDRGRELLTDNPRQPVSARITVPDAGPFAGRPVLAHVAATPDPVAKGMKPGEWVDQSAQADELVDLSAGRFTTGAVATDGTTTQGKEALDLSDEEKGALGKFFAKLGIGSKGDESKNEPVELSAEQVDELLDGFMSDNDDESDADADREPVAASLSDEDRKTLDMAKETADTAKRMTLKAGRTELSSRLSAYVADGVPPAQVAAARKALEGDEATIIDLANEREPAAAKALFATLDAAKGTIDFSERGSAVGAADDETSERKAKLDAWEKSSG